MSIGPPPPTTSPKPVNPKLLHNPVHGCIVFSASILPTFGSALGPRHAPCKVPEISASKLGSALHTQDAIVVLIENSGSSMPPFGPVQGATQELRTASAVEQNGVIIWVWVLGRLERKRRKGRKEKDSWRISVL